MLSSIGRIQGNGFSKAPGPQTRCARVFLASPIAATSGASVALLSPSPYAEALFTLKMASRTVVNLKPSLHCHTTCRGRSAAARAFGTSRPRRVVVRAEQDTSARGELSDDEAKKAAKQPVNKGGTAYIDQLPV